MTNINAAESAARSAHTLAIDRRRRASVTGVTDVCSFHETEVVLKIDSGMMILTGQGLHIAKLLLEDGRLLPGRSVPGREAPGPPLSVGSSSHRSPGLHRP